MQLVDTLPFIYCSYSTSRSAVDIDDRKKSNIFRGINTNEGSSIEGTLLSFCDSLAADTLKQGMKEGLGRVIDSAYLKVKVPKPPRRYSQLLRTALENTEPPCVKIHMPVQESDPGIHQMSACGKAATSCGEIEFVALNVQALEQINASRFTPVTPCSGYKKAEVVTVSKARGGSEIVRSATDFNINYKRVGFENRIDYDPCSIYDITEFPSDIANEPLANTMRSASASGHLSSSTPASSAPQVPPEMAPFLEEPLLLVGPKLEWKGYNNARKSSSVRRRKRQQQMTPQEQKKITRIVIGYTLAFFLLVIVTFYIVYFV